MVELEGLPWDFYPLSSQHVCIHYVIAVPHDIGVFFLDFLLFLYLHLQETEKFFAVAVLGLFFLEIHRFSVILVALDGFMVLLSLPDCRLLLGSCLLLQLPFQFLSIVVLHALLELSVL